MKTSQPARRDRRSPEATWRRRWLRIAALAVLAVAAPGCGGGGDAPPTAPHGGVNEAESNDFTPQAVGTLSTTDIMVHGTTSNVRDVDLYRVTATGTVNLFASLNWGTGSNLELTISNADGIFVRHVNTSGRPESCRLPALPAGSYTVRVGSISDASTAYDLTLGLR